MIKDVFGGTVKQGWRDAVYQEFLNRHYPRRNDSAVVYYMPGPVDRDRRGMLRNGFRNENLVAIDTDGDCVARVRAAGGVAMQADFGAVIANLENRDAASLIFADYLGGFSPAVWGLLESLFVSKGVNYSTVIAVNMLRGREQGRAADNIRSVRNGAGVKHRGQMFCAAVMHRIAGMVERARGRSFHQIDCDMILGKMRPVYCSYQTDKGKFYDTAVFNWPASGPLQVRRAGAKATSWDDAARLMPAMRAIRTKRSVS